jgi:hypothetical protein
MKLRRPRLQVHADPEDSKPGANLIVCSGPANEVAADFQPAFVPGRRPGGKRAFTAATKAAAAPKRLPTSRPVQETELRTNRPSLIELSRFESHGGGRRGAAPCVPPLTRAGNRRGDAAIGVTPCALHGRGKSGLGLAGCSHWPCENWRSHQPGGLRVQPGYVGE